MPNPRASIFADDDLDVSDFAPKAGPDKSAPMPEEVRAVAEAARFRSREPALPQVPLAAPLAPPPLAPPLAKRVPRRYRTGRNVQFNVKASQDTVDAFYAISDTNGWVLGETLEHALAALQRELTRDSGEGASPTSEP
jgi:hypothetical protein